MKLFTVKSLRVVLPAVLMTLSSCTDKPPAPKTEQAHAASFEPGVPGGISVETAIVTVNIAWVHKEPRELVLDFPDGKRETVKCGPEIVNFDQFHSGDQVKVTLTSRVAVAMGTESDPPDHDAAAIALAPKGGTPGGVIAGVSQVTATVSAINVSNHTATLVFPDGRAREVSVRPDIDLSKRKVGEKVVIRTTDIIALRVEKP